MLVGIISDTHDNLDSAKKAAEIFRERDIKIIFHLGDFIAPFTLKAFEGFELYGVFGNNDGEKFLIKKIAEELSFKIDFAPFEVELEGKSFLLLHGFGSIERTLKIVNSFAASQNYDFVIYGHTHKRDLRKKGKTMIINPGEACGYLTGKRSIAILNIENKNAEFVEF